MASVVDMFRNVTCVSTGVSRLLKWEAADGFSIVLCRVYGTMEGQEWVLIDGNVSTGFVYLDNVPASSFSLYRLEGVASNGDTCVVDNIPAQYTGDKAYRMIREIRRRENALYKAQPYGSPPGTLFLRKRFGEPCHECDSGCPASGQDVTCPSCLGTGIVGGYYKYPSESRFLMMVPHAPKQQGTESNQILAPVQGLRTVFGGIIQSHDFVRIGAELYDVVKSDVVASVANAPVVYMLTTVQLLPDDIRYNSLKRISDV